MYTFLYEGMNDDERFKIRLGTHASDDHRGAGFGGIMVSDVSACTDCTPQCTGKSCGGDGCGGSCGTCTGGVSCEAGVCTPPSPAVTMGTWRGFAMAPYSHPKEPGSQRLLVFTAHGRDSNSRHVQSVKYGDQSMTLLVTQTHCDGKCLHSSIWYLKEAGIAAASGTSFSVNWSNNPTDRGYDSVFFTGVRQSLPFDDAHSAKSSSSSVSCHANVVEAGHVQIYSASHKNQGDYSPLGGFTEAGDYKMGSEGKAAVGHRAGTGTSLTPGVSMFTNPQTIVCGEVQN
jgi:1,2-phenylacetyl-CoA epoxidase PaaB subunit